MTNILDMEVLDDEIEEVRKVADALFPEPDETSEEDESLVDEVANILDGVTADDKEPLREWEIQNLLQNVKALIEQAFPDVREGHISPTRVGKPGDPGRDIGWAYVGALPPEFSIHVTVTPTNAVGYIMVPNGMVADMGLDPRNWDDFVGWISLAVDVYEQEKENFRTIMKMVGKEPNI